MKVQKIEVKNFKAISEKEIEFAGCSVIVTGGNNKGKTSILRGLFDRMQGEKPELILKEGETEGYSIIELTDGSRIEWVFDEKKESFSFITKDGFKANTGVLKQIGQRYFGMKFDIDKFLTSTPKEQVATLGKLVGINFDDLNMRYKMAFDERTVANRELKNIQAQEVIKPVEIIRPDIEGLKQKKAELLKSYEAEKGLIADENTKLQEEYDKKVQEMFKEINKFNSEQTAIVDSRNFILGRIKIVEEAISGLSIQEFWNGEKLNEWLESLPKAQPLKPVEVNIEKPTFKGLPDRTEINKIEEEIEHASQRIIQFNNYANELSNYENHFKRIEAASKKALEADKAVKNIEQEKIELIKNAKIPNEFSFNEEGITYLGYPLSNNQISSSGKYIAALKLNYLVLGEISTMHFDASFLDKNSLKEVFEWAEKNDLQLLIERPDFEAGEIKYEIIQG